MATTTDRYVYPDEIKEHVRTHSTVRQISGRYSGTGVCPECHTVQATTTRHDEPSFRNKHGVQVKNVLLVVHGPRDNRCPGSRQQPVPWIDVMGLPSWDEMADLDRGAALMHLWKRYWEGSYAYARDNYPAAYIVDERLTALDPADACRHAGVVAGSWREIKDRIGGGEAHRLYDLALNHEREVSR